MQFEKVKKPDFEKIEENLDDVMEYAKTKFTMEQIGEQYDAHCERYEFVLKECVGYADPEMVAKAADQIDDLCKDQTEFLDFASGTGLIGSELQAKGFKNFTGLDASKGMIAKCEAKGHYKEIKNIYCGVGELPRSYYG